MWRKDFPFCSYHHFNIAFLIFRISDLVLFEKSNYKCLLGCVQFGSLDSFGTDQKKIKNSFTFTFMVPVPPNSDLLLQGKGFGTPVHSHYQFFIRTCTVLN